jgi:hypothetical protein
MTTVINIFSLWQNHSDFASTAKIATRSREQVAKKKERTMSSYKEGQINHLANGLENTGYTPDEVAVMTQKYLPSFLDVIRGNLEVVAIKLPEEKIIDTIIRVNRSVSPVYPEWTRKVMHKDLELSGPGEYDISIVQEWRHSDQDNGVVKGDVIYKHLKNNDMIKDQLGLADLLAIQAKGIAFFRKYFTGKAVFGWKSVVRASNDNLRVPDLIEDGGEVLLPWRWLGRGWDSCRPALRFASK